MGCSKASLEPLYPVLFRAIRIAWPNHEGEKKLYNGASVDEVRKLHHCVVPILHRCSDLRTAARKHDVELVHTNVLRRFAGPSWIGLKNAVACIRSGQSEVDARIDLLSHAGNEEVDGVGYRLLQETGLRIHFCRAVHTSQPDCDELSLVNGVARSDKLACDGVGDGSERAAI